VIVSLGMFFYKNIFLKRKTQELYTTQVESFRDLALEGEKWLNKHSNKNYGPFPGELPLELKGNSVFLGLLFPPNV